MRALIKQAGWLLILAIAIILTSCGRGTPPPAGASWPDFSLPMGSSIPAQTQSKIVLLIPMHGKLAATGTAIRNGFLAAYYYDKSQTGPTPKVQVIDSSQGDITTLYQQAVDQGASLVVGPLLKNNVAAIANLHNLPVPTLALNTLDNLTYSIPNFYQFGLSPIDETIQIAQGAYEQGHRNALVIAPQGNWGQTISTSFINQWQQLGGKVVGTLAYGSQKSLASDIQDLLKINQSDQRADELKGVLHENLRFIPRHREDADMIFLVALPAQARSIRPMLKFYYAGDLPVYSISAIYSGTPDPNRDHDLNGIEFCDMPWVLYGDHQLTTRLEQIRQRITTLWPKSFNNYPKLYGLGIDAYMLTSDLHELVSNPSTGVPGATGMLYIRGYGHIFRQCAFAKFVNGKPQLSS